MPLTAIEIISPQLRVGFWEISESWEELMLSGTWTEAEKKKLMQRRSPVKKAQFLAARLVITAMTGGSQRVGYREDGSPYLEDQVFFISISHTATKVAVALRTDGPVGVDIQQMPRPALLKAKSFYLSEAEQAGLRNPDDLTALHLYWSAKEALYKYAGNRQVDLRNDCRLQPFEPGPQGTLTGTIRVNGEEEQVELVYRLWASWVFVVTC